MQLFIYPVSIRFSISRPIPPLSALPQLLLSSFMYLLFPSLYWHVPFLPLYLHVSFPGSILHYASLHIWKSSWPIYFASGWSVNRLMGTRCAPLPSLHRWVSVHISNPSCYSYLLPIPSHSPPIFKIPLESIPTSSLIFSPIPSPRRPHSALPQALLYFNVPLMRTFQKMRIWLFSIVGTARILFHWYRR